MNINSQKIQIKIMNSHLKWRIINSVNGERKSPLKNTAKAIINDATQ